MRWLQDLSIRHKMTAITVTALGAPLVLACAVFVAYDQNSARTQLVQMQTEQAEIAGRLCVSALEFKDPESAATTLRAVSADTHVVAADLYDSGGALFASYARAGALARPSRLTLPAAGDRLERGRLVVTRRLEVDGSMLGTIVIERDLDELAVRLRQYLAVAAFVLLGAAFLAHVIASRLQRVLTGPVLHLVSVANAVKAAKDFGVRATPQGRDELGLLALAFNEMLGQIQDRDAAIRATSASLRESEQRLKAILDGTTAVIYAKDAEGRYILVNRRYEELFHIKQGDMIGKTDFDVFPAEQARTYQANDRRVIETRSAVQFEETADLEDGPHVYVSVKVPLFDTEGQAYAMCGISTDITESKHLEEARWRSRQLEEQSLQAREATRLKSEFLANMSHELRTPLNAIIGFATLLHNEKVGAVLPKQREFLGDVLTSARHLLQLINDVLDLAKVESGKMDFHPQPVQMEGLVKEVKDILRTIAAEKRIQVRTEVEPALGLVHLDPAKLKQVLYNYLSNALKFTPEEGRVTVRVRPEGEARFRIEVEDTGIGIRPEDTARLFKEFTQLDGGDSRQHGGTGLGLALCKRLVEAQGGSVGLRSTHGVGSTFFALLPRGTSETTTVETEPAPLVQRTGSPLILIVEDESRDRAWLSRTLGDAGYNVETAATGQEAVERLRSRRYDGITLDILLPDMIGWDVLREIRREGSPNQNTPVIVVTVVAEKVAAEFAVHDFLTKPVEPSVLLATLRRAGIAPNGGRPILVVDDDPAAIKLMRTALAEIGYSSIPASDGEEALKVAAADPPAAIVLDLYMPGMNGFEFMLRLRQTPQGRLVPVIVWTVADLTNDIRLRVGASAQGLVHKNESGITDLLSELERYIPPRRGGQADDR
jgi:PAS domain S-box-containing protein